MFLATLLLSAVILPSPGKAQFLKSLVNKATQSATNKATKPDSSAQKGGDSASVAQFMNNAMKGGGAGSGMTAQDSAIAKNFMTATGGPGLLYQYRMRYDIKTKRGDSTILDTANTAITETRNSHVDMDMLGMKMAVISHADIKTGFVVLYPDMKCYKVNIRDTAAMRQGKVSYQVTRVGAETVAGYSCNHARVTITHQGSKSPPIVEDIWTSTAVPGYAEIKKMTTDAHVTEQMLQSMEAAGCGGFTVKVVTHTDQISMEMLLITAEHKNFPASMFLIPAGYTVYDQQAVMNYMMSQKQNKQ
jgi:hypothetical protein